MNVSFEGYNEQIATFEAEPGVEAGKPVKITDNGKVSLCSTAGDVPCGICVAVRGDYASVQLGGYINATYTANTGDGAVNPALGFSYLVSDGSGAFKGASDGLKVLVVEIDSTNKKIGFIF